MAGSPGKGEEKTVPHLYSSGAVLEIIKEPRIKG
jgi:hypothetical protein